MENPPEFELSLTEAEGGYDPVRLAAALNMLVSEEDIVQYLRSKKAKASKSGEHTSTHPSPSKNQDTCKM